MDDETLENLVKHFPKFQKKIGNFNGQVDGLDALFIWQFVRLNETYKLDYDNTFNGKENDLIAGAFCKAWGISEPVHYNRITVPKSLSFEQSIVKSFDIRRYQDDEVYQALVHNSLTGHVTPKLISFQPPNYEEMYAFVVNVKDDHKSILKIIEHKLNEQSKAVFKKGKSKIRATSNKNELMKWFLCHHLRTEYNQYRGERELSYRNVANKFSEITGQDSIDEKQVRRNIDNFREMAQYSPYTFFLRTD